MNKIYISIIGGPGTGKGTISEMICNNFNFFHLSVGQLIRDEIKKGTKIGLEMKEFEEKGLMVPNDITNKLVENFVKNVNKNILFDGFPREIEQAIYLHKHRDVSLVINLKANKKNIISRLSGRRVCSNGHTYHMKTNPPEKEGICDIDGLKLEQRKDDNPKAIEVRLNEFKRYSDKTLKHYKELGILKEIDANGTPDEIYQDVKAILTEYL